MKNILAIAKPKLQSKVVWTVVGAWVIKVLFELGIVPAPNELLAVYDSLLTLLTAVGVLNNPNDKVNW